MMNNGSVPGFSGEPFVTQKIDWITAYYKKEVALQIAGDVLHDQDELPRRMTGISGPWEKGAMRGYTIARKSAFGVQVGWTMPLRANGVCVSYPGGSIEGGDGQELLRSILNAGGRISRLDLAVDLLGVSCDVKRYYDMIRDGEGKGAFRKVSLLQSETGTTVYVGSRQSERFVRLYDKAGESGTNTNWVRAEIEIKGEKAHNIAAFMASTNSNSAMQSIITSYVTFPNDKVWNMWMNNAEPVTVKSEKKLTSTRDWLLTTVANSLAKEVRMDEDFMEDFLDVVLSKI